MICITGINKKFGRIRALKDVSLTLEKGTCVALIGPNGCGKTTLIKAILGMALPDSGDITLQNQSVLGKYAYRDSIGYMPQIGRYPDNMTVAQIIDTVKAIRKQEKPLDTELLESFGVARIYQRRMRALSGGMVQKLSAILAFLFDPEILILDEPTAGLDVLSSEILKEKIVRERMRGKLVLITSHILSELEDMITHVAFMQEGKICFHKTIGDLKQSTGEEKIVKAIAKILKPQLHEGDS